MIKPLTCPICDQALPPQSTEATPTFPFCSQRCQNVDLLRWSKGDYAIKEDLSQRPDIVAAHLEEIEAAMEEEMPDEEGSEGW